MKEKQIRFRPSKEVLEWLMKIKGIKSLSQTIVDILENVRKGIR
jgi:hypothetical protein